MAADSVARGLALAALGQYNKLIKVKQWTVDTVTPIPWTTGYPYAPVKGSEIKYTWVDGNGVSHSSSFNVYNGVSVWKYEIDHTKGYDDPEHPGQKLGYDAKWIYFKITLADDRVIELQQPVAQFTFKKIILDFATHGGVLPPVTEAEDNAIYFLEQEDPLHPGQGSGKYKLYMRTFNESTHTYEWTNIGSTEFDLTGYQKKIDNDIKYITKNYDTATSPTSPTAKNVVGSANQALAAIGPALNTDGSPHTDLTGDITDLGLGTQVLNTLVSTFNLKSDIVTALNEHEKELKLNYDYGTGKIKDLGIYETYVTDLASILKEIGDMSNLDYIDLSSYPGPSTDPEDVKRKWVLDNYKWTIIDAINAAEEKERIKKLDASETDKTLYIRQYQHERADEKYPEIYHPVAESDKISISRDEIRLRTNPSINAYATYDLFEEGSSYDPETEPVVESKTDVLNIVPDKLIMVSEGIYLLNATLSAHTKTAASIATKTFAAPATITKQYLDTQEIQIQIGTNDIKYTPVATDTISVNYTGRLLTPYGKVDIPHLKIHKVTPIEDEWYEEDVELDAAGWILPSGGTKYTHEYKMARILSNDATAGPTILSKSDPTLTILNFTKGSRIIHFQTDQVPPPTSEVTARIRYQIPSEILAKYYLEYEGQNYDLALCGDEIDILKNGLLEDVTVEECTEAGVPLPGLLPGDKYIDFSFMLASGAVKHAYLAVKDLLDPYKGYKAIKITYITDPTQPDYKQNRVELVINETKNDRTRPAGSTTPVHPTLIQNDATSPDGQGLYIADADEETYGAVEFAKRTYPTDPDKTKDEVLNPGATSVRKVIKPYDLLDFVRLSESVDPSLKYIYEKDTTTHEHFNKTMIDAFNEIASMKIDTEKIQSSTTASEKEKKMFIEAYRLFTTPDPATPTLKNYLGDKIYNYKEIVITETLKTDNPPTTLYPDQLNEYTMFYLSKKEDSSLPGLYVYTGGKFVRVSGDPIIDSDVPLVDIPAAEVQENFFYRTHDASIVMARYALKQDAIISGYTLDEQGLHIPGTATPVVLTEANFNNYYNPTDPTKPITDDINGPLFKITDGGAFLNVTYVYNFNKSPVSLSFHDNKTNKWVDIISKYKVVNTFVDKSVDPHTILPGNEWEIYILLAEDSGYEPGIYIWDRSNYISVSSASEAIVDVTTLPVSPQIKNNLFYRTHDNTIIDGRYALTDYAVGEGYVLTPTGIKKGSDPEVSWAAVKADWTNWTTAQAPATEPRIDPALNPKGPIFMITKDGVQSLYYNFNTSPVTLQFHDPETNTWVDMISKYKAVNTFDGVVGEEWQIYVLLNDTTTHKKGVYIWDRNNFIAISSVSEAIIDVATLPTVNIEENSLYRIHDTDTILSRHDLTDTAKKAGWLLTPSGVMDPAGATTFWESVDLTQSQFLKSDDGPIYKVKHADATEEVVFNYHRTKTDLKFHDEANNRWVDVIPTYKVVSKLPTKGEEYQIYFVLNELYADGRPGTYIWTESPDATQGGVWSQVNSPAITELSGWTKTREGEFYLYHVNTEIDKRYKLSNTALTNGYTCDFQGITKNDPTTPVLTTWADVWTNQADWFTPAAGATEALIIEDTHGDIFKVTDNPTATTPTYRLVYNFKTSELGLKFWDYYTGKWVNLVSKYVAVNTFTDAAGVLIPGDNGNQLQRDWEIYILLNDTPKYKKGTYIWDRTDYVSITGDTDAIIDVDDLPTLDIEDNKFYRTKTKYTTEKRYDLSTAQKAGGAHLSYDKIKLTNGDEFDYTQVQGLIDAGDVVEAADGPISKISDGTTTSFTYKFINPVNALQYHTDDYWTDIIAKFKVVSELPTTGQSTTEKYILLEDTTTHIAGEYIWDGAAWQLTATNTKKPILDEKPAINANDSINYFSEYFFRTKNEYTIDNIYGLSETAIQAGYVVSVDGITLPDATSKTWGEVLTDWATYYDPADPTKPIVDNNKGDIFKVTKDGTATLIYNYNSSPISLEFWDDSKKEYVEIISKYEGVTTFDNAGTLREGKEYQIYILLNNCTVGTNSYEKGIYIWNGKDYILAADNVKPIIDVDVLPVKEIKEDCFYRTHDITEIDKRYKLSNTALTAGYTCDFQGVTDSVGTLTTWANVWATPDPWFNPVAPATEALIIEDTHGDIFKICKDPTATTKVYELYYNFNTSPVTLQFYDSGDWTEVISKYIAVNTFTKADGTLIPHADDSRYQNEWQIYVLLNDTPNYKKGTYIWDRTDYVSITGDTDAIIDVDTLPTLEIEENKFYRTHDDAIIRTRYKLSDGAIEEGYSLTPDGIKLGVGTGSTLTDWTTVTTNLNDWINPETGKTYPRIEQDLVHGPIYMVNPFPAVPAAKSLYYNFNTSPTSLQFHDLKTNDWIEMISKYEAVNSFYEWEEGITPPTRKLKVGKEWQIYMLLNDDIDPDTEEVLYKRGIYIWDRASETATQAGDYIAVSSITDCIIDVEELPTTNINENALYRVPNKYSIVSRYSIKDDFIKLGYKCNVNGITDVATPAVTTSWADILTNWADWYDDPAGADYPDPTKVIKDNVDGYIYKISEDPAATTPVYELRYNYYETPTSLYYNFNNKWVNIISKYTILADPTKAGDPTQLYIVTTEMRGELDPGIYIWDDNTSKYISISGKAKPYIVVEAQPATPKETFYVRKNMDVLDANRYALTQDAIDLGYTLVYNGIIEATTPPALHPWTEIFTNWTDWTTPDHPSTGDPIRIEVNAAGKIWKTGTECVYNYVKPEKWLEFKEDGTWYDSLNNYIAVNRIAEITTPQVHQLYVLMEQDGDKPAGLYRWNRKEFVKVEPTSSAPVIVVNALPTTDISTTSVYELRTDNTIPTVECYKLTDAEVTAGSFVDSYGLHTFDTSTPPVETITCFADLFTDWTTHSTHFELDTATPTTGTIWKYTEGTETEFRWSNVKPTFPEKRTQLYVYNETLTKWINISDDNNTINGVTEHNTGKQTSESLELIWEGSQAEYEALTKINPHTLYLVHDDCSTAPYQSYNALIDKPSINDVVLQGDMTLQDLGIQAFTFKGNVATEGDLPTADQKQGDLYYIEDTKEFKAWNGAAWKLAGKEIVDMTLYQLKHDDTLLTTAKEVVPAINEVFQSMGLPEQLSITWTAGIPSSVANYKAWYTKSTNSINFTMTLTGLGINLQGKYTLGKAEFTSGITGAHVPAFTQALSSCDIDAGATDAFTSTNCYIDNSGNIICNAFIGQHSITLPTDPDNPSAYYTEDVALDSISISGTIFCTDV